MELCEATLDKYINGQKFENLLDWETIQQSAMPEKHVYGILQHILNGLLYIHCLNEVHRDLSPQNGMIMLFILMLTIISPLAEWVLENS